MKLLRRAFALACISLLLSCGGGLDVAINGGGVGTGGTGIVAGTVTGLGSVIVDGVRYDESQAALVTQPDLVNTQSLALTQLHVGQYVYLTLDASGTPTAVRVASQLVGPAANVNAAAGQFTVWGQRVVVNADPTQGPVTVFSGYQSVAAMHAGDPVQVYGVLQSSDSGADVIHATRIEHLAAAGTPPARVTGTLQAGNGGSLLLAGARLNLSAAASGAALSAGQAVTAVIPWTQTMPMGGWQASSVALLAPPTAASVQVSGAAHLLANGRVQVQGISMDVSQVPAAARQSLHEGGYVTVNAVPDKQDGTDAVASAVAAVPAGGRPAQLRGSITAVLGPTSFVVRGQTVNASSAQFAIGSRSDLVVGNYVDVQGTQTEDSVTATQISVTAAPPQNAVLDLSGTVQSVDAGTGEVQLTMPDGKSVDLMLKPGVALPKAGDSMHAAGYWTGAKLNVRDVDPPSTD